jgi:hypothetical protein
MNKISLILILCLIVFSTFLTGCVYEPLEVDLNTLNIYPITASTFQVGSAGMPYLDGWFDNINGVPVGGGGLEIDPLWSASPSFGITAGDILTWNNAPALYVPYVGATGNIDLNAKEVTNGTLNAMVGKGTWTASGTWKLPAMYFNGDITSDRWLSHATNTFFGIGVVGDGNLVHTVGATGYYNTAFGNNALYSDNTGFENSAFGYNALKNNTEGYFNSAFGENSLLFNEGGDFNTGIGVGALSLNNSGSFNTAVGVQSSHNGTSGSYNTAIGVHAGYSNSIGDRNVFIGYQAGYNELGSDTLYIENSDTTTPLIYGNFSTDLLTIYGKLGIGVYPPTAYLHLPAGTAAAGTAPLKLTMGTLLAAPEAGVLEYDGTGIYLTNTNHRRFISQAADSIITSQTVANTVVQTTVYTAVLNANELKAYRVYRLWYFGKFSTHDAADQITVVVNVNGTTLVTLQSTAGLVTDAPFSGSCVFTVRTTGVAGTISSYGNITLGTKIVNTNTSSVSVNTTAINYSTLVFQWSNADAGNTITLDQAFVEVLD